MRGTPFYLLPEKYPILTSQFAGKKIARRTPYFMQADLVVPASTNGRSFDPSSFLNNQEFPFEVVCMVMQITTLDSSAVPQVDPNIGSLYRYVQMTMKLQGVARDMTKGNTRLSATLPDVNSRVVDFAAPLYLEKSEGFDIAISNAITSASAAGGIRMEIGFEGSLIEFSGT